MDNVEKIKNRLDIVDVIGSYIKLEKSGLNFKACCPFHNEKTPSFFVSPSRGAYKCFGCGEGGDIFSFVEKFEGVDFKGALKILAEKAGVVLEKEDPQKTNEKRRIYDILEKTTIYFEKNLKENQSVLNYLGRRGISGSIIKKFRLGFAKADWQDLYNFLKKENYTDYEINKAGLIKKQEKGEGFYDRFRERIIFPLFDNSNQVIAFSGRYFGKGGSSKNVPAKYLNSPETILFDKSNTLYGYNFAKTKIRKMDFSILVEGQVDLLMCHQNGYDNAVASSGTALSQKHLILLKKLSTRLIIAFDGDNAGFLSACRATKIALREGMEVRLIEIPKGLDPAEFILQNRLGWKKALKEAKHIVNFYLNKLIFEIKKENNGIINNISKRKLGKVVQEKVLPFVALIESEIEKANFVEEIANQLELPDKVIWEELKKIRKEDFINFPILLEKRGLTKKLSLNKDKKNRKQIILRQLSGLYWWQKDMQQPIFDFQSFEKNIKNKVGEEIFEKIKNLPEKIKNEIIFEVEILYDEFGDIEKKIIELFKNLEVELLNDKLKKIISEQKQAERTGQDQLSLKKLEIYNQLSKQKNKLLDETNN